MVTERTALHVRTANLEHPHVSGAGGQQRIQLAEEEAVVRRRTGRILQNILVRPDERISAGAGIAEKCPQQEDTEKDSLHFLRSR